MPARVLDGALEVMPDQSMLKDPTTEFPVFVDPGFSSARVNWTMIDSGLPSTSYWTSSDQAKVGTYDSGGHKLRSFFPMNTNGLQRKHILSATFTAQLQHSWSCTARPVDDWEWCGANFEPRRGRWLFVKIRKPGITVVITGPWERGSL